MNALILASSNTASEIEKVQDNFQQHRLAALIPTLGGNMKESSTTEETPKLAKLKIEQAITQGCKAADGFTCFGDCGKGCSKS